MTFLCRSVFVTALVLLISTVSAGWERQLDFGYPIQDKFFNAYVTTTRTFSMSFWHTDAFFFGTVITAEIFPQKCRGDPENQFGWEYWKNKNIFSRVTVVQGKLILTFTPVYGYTVVKPETVKCGPFVDKDGKQLYQGNPLSGDDAFLSFTVIATTDAPAVEILRMEQGVFVTPQILAYNFIEEDFRLNGIQLFIQLRNDVWNASYLPDIAAGLECLPAAINCFAGIVELRHFSISPMSPNIVTLNVSVDEARLFNIKEITTPKPDITEINFALRGAGLPDGRRLGNKGVQLSVDPANVRYRIYETPTVEVPIVKLLWRYNSARQLITPDPTDPFIDTDFVPSGVLNTTEDCLRGKDTSAACARVFMFEVVQNNGMPFFQVMPNGRGIEDTRRFGITSQAANFSNFYWLRDARPNSQLARLLWVMNPTPDYETWFADELILRVPHTSFILPNLRSRVNREPPLYSPTPFKMIVYPSPGSIRGILRDVTQREIAEGGIVFHFVMDGESFNQAALDSFVTLLQSPNVSDAWMQTKSTCVLPPGSVYFATTRWGTANNSHIVAEFRRCPDFETLYPDQVTLAISSANTRSGLPLTVNAPSLTFKIFKSPGAMRFPNVTDYTENDVRAGGANFSFDLKLTSERWPNGSRLDACFAQICHDWTTTAVPNPTTGADVDSWANSARRSAICNMTPPDDGSDPAFVRLDDRTVRFRGRYDPLYDTRKGEQILISIPRYCTASDTMVEGNATIRIEPQAGFVAFHLCTDTSDGPELSELSEHAVRAGGFKVCVIPRLDDFEDLNALLPRNRREMLAALVSDEAEAFGFNNKKAGLVGEPAIIGKRVTFTFQGDSTYDIAANETLFFNLSSTWMASGAMPTPSMLSIRIYVSAGTVNVTDWFGADGRNVTEEDLRWGRVWFEFSLLGDQWRRERDPYTQIWSGDLPSSTTSSFSTDTARLVPNLEYFRFYVLPTGHEILRLRLQSNDEFDVAQRETVTVTFGSNTVASGLPPLFQLPGASGLTGRVPSWTFLVNAVPGRVILSGSIQNVDEKKIRRSSSLSWILTLVGETWRSNISNFVTPKISSFNANSDPSDALAGFERLKDSLLPASSVTALNTRTLRLDVVPSRFFEITQDETVRFGIDGTLTRSGLGPTIVRPLLVNINPTGGELRLASTLTSLTEEHVRTRNFTVDLALDGDQWNMIAINPRIKEFLTTGFSSTSPVLLEPNGFLQNQNRILHLSRDNGDPYDVGPILQPNFQADASTITVYFFPTPEYDIDADETITFTVPSALYVSSLTGDLPDPATISFTISAVSRTLVAIVDPNLAYTSTFESQPRTLESAIGGMLSTATSRVQSELNTTSRRERDKLLVMLVKFVGGASSADQRSPAELATTLLALKASYLYEQVGIRYVYFQDDPPPESELYPQAAAEYVTESVDETSRIEIAIWICVAVAFALLIALAFVGFMQYQQRHLSVGLTSSGARDKFGQEQRPYNIESKEAESLDVVTRAAHAANRQREKAAELRREGDAAGALKAMREGILDVPTADRSPHSNNNNSNPAASPTRQSDDSGGNNYSPPSMSAAAAPGRSEGDVVATLSDGRAVQRPMTMKEYVRAHRLQQDEATITHRDLVLGDRLYDATAADGGAIPGEWSPDVEKSGRQAAEARRANASRRNNADGGGLFGPRLGDPDDGALTDHSRRLPQSGLPPARLDNEGMTEAELSELRRRRPATLQRRKAAIDAMIDF